MGSLFKPPEMPKTTISKPTVLPTPEVESAEDISKMYKKRYGRSATILTGDLEPLDIGKRRLLG